MVFPNLSSSLADEEELQTHNPAFASSKTLPVFPVSLSLTFFAWLIIPLFTTKTVFQDVSFVIFFHLHFISQHVWLFAAAVLPPPAPDSLGLPLFLPVECVCVCVFTL